MIRIALDAMGGDHAPAEVVEGGLAAAGELGDIHLTLVGRQEILNNLLAGKNYPKERVTIVDAPEIITSDDAPVSAVRRKKNSSMMQGINLLKESRVDALVSAGNTGALMAGSLLAAGRLEGIERPALAVVAPTFGGGNVVIMDVGANMDAKPEHLLHYALMGGVYAREVLQKTNPRVALLNIGTEEHKGSDQARRAYTLMKDSMPSFCGNLEARDILKDAADVVICDGFVGNIVLKTIEGLAEGLFASMKEAFQSGIKSKLAAAVLLPELRKIRNKLDYEEYGGAPLMGIDGVCIKAHGSSKARAIRNAIATQAYLYAGKNVNGQIKKELAALTTMK